MENQGFEPRIPKVTDLQSAEVANASHSPLFGSKGRDRTYDQLINSQLHYRCATLEYLILVPGRNLQVVSAMEGALPTHYSQ